LLVPPDGGLYAASLVATRRLLPPHPAFSAILRRWSSRCVGSVSAVTLGTAVVCGGTMGTAARLGVEPIFPVEVDPAVAGSLIFRSSERSIPRGTPNFEAVSSSPRPTTCARATGRHQRGCTSIVSPTRDAARLLSD
jgi:hypothetical protein